MSVTTNGRRVGSSVAGCPVAWHMAMPAREKYEVTPRVERVEQQLDALPAAWKAFAGPPMAMHYFGTHINTFRANPALQRPPDAYSAWAVPTLRRQLGA